MSITIFYSALWTTYSSFQDDEKNRFNECCYHVTPCVILSTRASSGSFRNKLSSLFLCVHVMYRDIFCVCKWLVCFPELLLFFIVLNPVFSKQIHKKTKCSWIIKNRALVLQKAHSFGDLRNLLDIPKGAGKYMDKFSSGNPHLSLVELVFILFTEAITSRKKFPAAFLVHFPYIGFLKEKQFK